MPGVIPGGIPRVIDGRHLCPPEPLELTLAALDDLADGDELLLLIHCRPQPLLGLLDRYGYAWNETIRPDGSYEIRIRRAPRCRP